MENIRNIAIIAHVDHGKTTLVDNMLKQSGIFRDNQIVEECAMDSGDLERERGITILAKCTSLSWQDIKINVVDTPGHADFGGEVERILSMVDGVLLLVDAAEGPMPQTKFVLSKALKLGLKPIVVINKIDRASQERITEAVDEILELFMMLDANDAQLDFPVLYASGRSGWAVSSLTAERKDLSELFDLIIKHVPEPKKANNEDFSMLVTTREYNTYLGRILTGRIHSGNIKINQAVKVLDREGNLVENAKITKILTFRGLERVPTEQANSGDIIAIAGIEKANVSDTICDPSISAPLPSTPIDPPTLSITISINDSPIAGREGSKLTSRMLKDRLLREAEGNVSIKVTESENRDAFEVAGRGELQLGVLIETMRREKFELSVSRPKVLYKTSETGEKLEPIEEIIIDVDDEYIGEIVQTMALRKGDVLDIKPSGGGKTRLSILAPSRGLIGYHGQFLTITRGTGVMNKIFHGYDKYKGNIEGRRNGVLISNADGEVTAYALWNLEERGKLFIQPGAMVYRGMIIGEHNRDNDLEVNPLKSKQLSNVRAAGKDEMIKLSAPVLMTLEQAMSYIQDDERVEITPMSIRLRKAILDSNERKRAGKN